MSQPAAKPIWPKVPALFVQKNLTGHKILGLAVSAILYLICLSGTLTVFYLDTQRWESAATPDIMHADPAALSRALADASAHRGKDETVLYVYPPTHAFPRINVGYGPGTRSYDAQGNFVTGGGYPLTTGISELHYQLHLPTTIGFFLVGVAGVVMVALIAGGLLAHPRILKDAFTWRLGGSARLNRTDIHNRVGVWAAPFHIVIALTGALIGTGQVLFFVAGVLWFHGDAAKVSDPLYDHHAVPIAPPSVETVLAPDAIANAFVELKAKYPQAEPDFIEVEGLGSGNETLSISAELPGRLVYGEEFIFDSAGHMTSRNNVSDGPAGKQAYGSLYKLHFGSFGGAWVRWAFVLLGAGLCLICTTGMDIWLLKSAQKGRPYPRLHKAWTGFVWGAPIAMAVTGALGFVVPALFIPWFWSLLALCTLGAVFVPSQPLVSRIGRYSLAGALLLMVAAHVLKFGAQSLSAAAWPSNLTFVLCAAVLLVLANRPFKAA